MKLLLSVADFLFWSSHHVQPSYNQRGQTIYPSSLALVALIFNGRKTGRMPHDTGLFCCMHTQMHFVLPFWRQLVRVLNYCSCAMPIAVTKQKKVKGSSPSILVVPPLFGRQVSRFFFIPELYITLTFSSPSRNMHGLTPADYAKSEQMRAALKTQPLINTVTNTTLPMSKTSVLSRQRPVVLLGTGKNRCHFLHPLFFLFNATS